MNEFGIIANYFTRPTKHRELIRLSVGDDAAILQIPNDYQLVTSIDTLVENVHFPKTTPPSDVGYKSLAVSLSDLAAMGAKPFSTLLSITLPKANTDWLNEFARGFFEIANQFDIDLIGGDTTRGPLMISTVVYGLLHRNQGGLLRSAAKPGDLIYVTGTLGDAGCALAQRQKNQPIDPYLLKRLNRPTPRVKIGNILSHIASSAIDISDGLAADLHKILQASQVGANIYASNLPLSTQLQNYCSYREAWQYALTAGDDFELCFTMHPSNQAQLQQHIASMDVKIHHIGEICAQKKLTIYDDQQQPFPIKKEGYEHF